MTSKYIEREREPEEEGGSEGGGGVYAYHTPTHTHTHFSHTLYMITIYNLMKISSILHPYIVLCVVDVDF